MRKYRLHRFLTAALAAHALFCLPQVASVQAAGTVGLHLLMEVDIAADVKAELRSEAAGICGKLQEGRIACTGSDGFDDFILLDIADKAQNSMVFEKIKKLLPGNRYETSTAPITERNMIALRVTDVYNAQLSRKFLAKPITALSKRLTAAGIGKFSIVPQGSDRLEIDETGIAEPDKLLAVLNIHHTLAFRLVDDAAASARAKDETTAVPVADELLDQVDDSKNIKLQKLPVERRELVSGRHMANVGWSIDVRTGKGIATFRFDRIGTKQFESATKEFVHRQFAIVLDGKVISAPIIVEPILGGSGEVAGYLTMQDVKVLAEQLRNTDLQSPYRLIEVRSIEQNAAIK
jgi:SecD/SecF fusion protein